MSKSYTISDVELATFAKWKEEHEPKCVYHGDTMANPANFRYFTPTSAYTICFTPTGIGDVCKVKCLCGEDIDITDDDSW